MQAPSTTYPSVKNFQHTLSQLQVQPQNKKKQSTEHIQRSSSAYNKQNITFSARQNPLQALLFSALLMVFNPTNLMSNLKFSANKIYPHSIEHTLQNSNTNCSGVSNPKDVLDALDDMTTNEKIQVFNHSRLSEDLNHTCSLEETYNALRGQNYKYIVRLMKLTGSKEHSYADGFVKLCKKMSWDNNITCLTTEQLIQAEEKTP